METQWTPPCEAPKILHQYDQCFVAWRSNATGKVYTSIGEWDGDAFLWVQACNEHPNMIEPEFSYVGEVLAFARIIYPQYEG